MGKRDPLNPSDTNFQNQIMGIMLPPVRRDGTTYAPGVNDYFDADRRGQVHGGIDFNYHYGSGEKVGQNGINIERPTVHAPVSGEVTNVNEKKGIVEITDPDGYKHQIHHMELGPEGSRLKRGDTVTTGDPIGKMGNKGTDDHHVHYQIKYPNEALGTQDASRKIKPKDILIDPNQFFDAPNYEPGPYSATPPEPGHAPAPPQGASPSPGPGTQGPDAQSEQPGKQRTAQAPASGTAATRQMSYRQAPAGSGPYDDLYDFSPPGRDEWGALPDHIREWLFPEPGSGRRPIGSPIARPLPYYPTERVPGFYRRPTERPPHADDPRIMLLPYYPPKEGSFGNPAMPLPYYPPDRGLFSPEEVTEYYDGPEPEHTDFSLPARKPYTMKEKFDFLKNVYNEAKPVSERTGLSLPFIIGHSATETGWGKWVNGNNLFNLEAGRDWKGPTMQANGKTIRAYPSYKESMKDYIAHFRNTPGYTDLFDAETRTNPRRLADAVQNGGFRASDPLYAKKIMLNVGHPLIRGYGEDEE